MATINGGWVVCCPLSRRSNMGVNDAAFRLIPEIPCSVDGLFTCKQINQPALFVPTQPVFHLAILDNSFIQDINNRFNRARNRLPISMWNYFSQILRNQVGV